MSHVSLTIPRCTVPYPIIFLICSLKVKVASVSHAATSLYIYVCPWVSQDIDFLQGYTMVRGVHSSLTFSFSPKLSGS